MCTAITYHSNDFYFGRNLDYEMTYGEKIAVMPRNYELPMRHNENIKQHYALIGMAHVKGGYPLYYDAINEKGLCVAGLNFVGNAFYNGVGKNIKKIASFELIPWLLATCASAHEAENAILSANVCDTPYDDTLPVSQLHWLISDKKECLTLEITKDGVNIYDNPMGVLTNNPPFPFQMFALNNYRALSSENVPNRFSNKISLSEYSRGMGALGLPGDTSSQSRFIKAAFTKLNSPLENTENKSVSQFFHMLSSVEQCKGLCLTEDGKYEITQYSSCCNADKGIYYYKTYYNHTINAINMHDTDLNGENLITFSLIK